MAKLDSSLNVHSVFFFLVRGHWYNFLGHYTQEAVREIHALGFEIGLHFAPPLHIEGNQETYRQQLLRDFSTMCAEFPGACTAFSWHVPPPFLLERGKFEAPHNMVDMYSERYFHHAKYVSDSSLRSPYSYLKEVFTSGRHSKIQLLLHPECWMGGQMNDLADLIGEILRSVIADGELDLREKVRLPSGIPKQALDEIAALISAAVRTVQGKHREGRRAQTERS
jgi:hypothetical protein